MAVNNKADQPLKTGETAQDEPKTRSYTNQAQLVQSLIDAACMEKDGKTIRDEKSKMTTADLIRLMQFQREMAKEQPVDIVEMRWIDPPKR